jgi:hypothetical protein
MVITERAEENFLFKGNIERNEKEQFWLLKLTNEKRDCD